jgi:hypothetical protein
LAGRKSSPNGARVCSACIHICNCGKHVLSAHQSTQRESVGAGFQCSIYAHKTMKKSVPMQPEVSFAYAKPGVSHAHIRPPSLLSAGGGKSLQDAVSFPSVQGWEAQASTSASVMQLCWRQLALGKSWQTSSKGNAGYLNGAKQRNYTIAANGVILVSEATATRACAAIRIQQSTRAWHVFAGRNSNPIGARVCSACIHICSCGKLVLSAHQ